MTHWREWKRQFTFVVGDERFAAKYREMAGRSYRQMLAYERFQGPATTISINLLKHIVPFTTDSVTSLNTVLLLEMLGFAI